VDETLNRLHEKGEVVQYMISNVIVLATETLAYYYDKSTVKKVKIRSWVAASLAEEYVKEALNLFF
jgi:hypothetical protein